MSLYRVMLFVHIGAGFIGLFVAPVAMIVRKGGKAHRRWGGAYFWSMSVVCLTALVLAVLNPNLFLLLLAVFSFYQAFIGYRVLSMKRPDIKASHRPIWLDWGGSVLMAFASLGFFVVGLVRVLSGNGFGTVALVFGVLGATFAINDMRRYVNPPQDKRAWWFTHMNGFLGAYIATVTAFSSTNFDFLPLTLRWLWPTVLGTIGISLWNFKYRKHFGQLAQRTEQSRNLPEASTATS